MATEPIAATRPKTNAAVIFALIMSVLWLYGIGSILGIVFGIIGARECDRTGQGGHTAGILAAILGLLGALVAVVLMLTSH